MTTVVLEEQIIPLDKIINKNSKSVSLKETISLIFHATVLISNDSAHPDKEKWKELYNEYKTILEKQNKIKWPQIIITRNDYQKRIDILTTSSSFVKSNNIFILLLRLLFVENYKRTYIYKAYGYYKILGHKINDYPDIIAKNMSVSDLFDLLKKHLFFYKKIYNEDLHFEYQLVNTILKQID
jgi:hypothetical protein